MAHVFTFDLSQSNNLGMWSPLSALGRSKDDLNAIQNIRDAWHDCRVDRRFRDLAEGHTVAVSPYGIK